MNQRKSLGQSSKGTLLRNDVVAVTISDTGKLLSVANHLASETYDFVSDEFALDTDMGILSNADKRPREIMSDKNRIIFLFEFGPVEVALIYTLGDENGFVRRELEVANSGALRVTTLRMGHTTFAKPADEVIHYLTFWMAPTVEFIRYTKGGLFTGIENPFYRAQLNKEGVGLSFEPGLILAPGEGYKSDAQFIGVYKKSGVMIEDSDRPFRYKNASGHIPIDRNESRAMRAFALDYLSPKQESFLNINYQFFHPLPIFPESEEDLSYFQKTIDTFAEIGGDMIIFRPLHPYTKPDAKTLYWNVIPDDETVVARRVVDYAAEKGVSYGFYMGCAAHGDEGNSAGLNFRADKPAWKKMDAAGRRAPDNCIASDDFYDWWFQVHDNTIKRYDLSNWSWDPSLGSAMNCFDEGHGHIAGKGAYKGWRRCIDLMRRLKESNPGLFIQGFYGTKHFGLWGLKHTDQHEVYNEQTDIMSKQHTQISDDRQNADGLRFQNYWSMRFRFLPAVLGHSLAHRMNEGEFDRELIKAWDFYGWRYGVMSSLSVSGSVMPAILPIDSKLVPGYADFYQKWSAWARDNFEYVQYTEPFGEQVQPGAIDGYARIKGDHGFVFLFNGNPRPTQITFEVGDEINLQRPGRYEFLELYPAENPFVVLGDERRSIFPLGKKMVLTLPPNTCKLLELRPVGATREPVLLGISGQIRFDGERLELTAVKGKPGKVIPIAVRLPEPESVLVVTVNGVEQKFSQKSANIHLQIGFAGEESVRELDDWQMADGAAFEFPREDACDPLNITTAFMLSDGVPKLLREAAPANIDEMGRKIEEWQNNSDEQEDYNYHNFTCARPDRLWLILPFLDDRVEDLAVEIHSETADGQPDHKPVLRYDPNSLCYFVDITDFVDYGGENTIGLSMRYVASNGFMGPFLMYPEEPMTEQVLSTPGPARSNVVFTKSLIPPGPPRYSKNAKRPRILSAEVAGNVTLKSPAELRAQVDLPPGQIESVMYSHSGFPWMGKEPMTYDAEKRRWVAQVRPGSRWLIQENEYVYVWAVAKEGLYSDFYPVKVGWDFTD